MIDESMMPAVEPIEIEKKEVMPDSRPRLFGTPKGSILTPIGWMQPVFCASCGLEGGLVPEQDTRFVCWLCGPKANDCASKYGEMLDLMIEPDEKIWAAFLDEQLTKYGRLLTVEEVQKIVADSPSSPIATLITKGR